MKKTTVRCPKCGASFLLPEHEHVQCGTVIAKDSNMGTVYLQVEDEEPCMPKRGPDGKFLPKNLEMCDNDELMFEHSCRSGLADKIREEGAYVKNHRLFRRWIMGQMFHILRDESSYKGYTSRLRSYGVRYMWKVIRNEIHDMYVIRRNGDLAEYERRHMWFNEKIVREIGSSFADQLEKIGGRKPRHKCKGRPYLRLPGFGDVFCDEFDAKVVGKIRDLVNDIGSIDPDCVEKLCDFCIRFKEGRYANLKMPVAFVNAYKANGAYFTLRNMLMFHGCILPAKVTDEYGKGIKLRGVQRQLAILDNVASSFKDEGWQLMGLLRDTIEANGVDVAKKIESWKK